MYLHKLIVDDFQSIEHAELEFKSRASGGSITTIVGPSSVGKSALLRALYLWARNSSSVPVRAHSETGVTKITAILEDESVSIERGKSLSNYYVGAEKYAKAGVSVPEEVQKIMGLNADTPELHYSTQFDKPYLLDETGAVVSAALGKLTKASLLRDAAKEGNRRSLATKRTITTRKEDIVALREQIENEFSHLRTEEAILSKVEKFLSEAAEQEKTLLNITAARDSAVTASQAYESAILRASQTKDASKYLSAATDAYRRVTEIESAITLYKQASAFKTIQVRDATKVLAQADHAFSRVMEFERILTDLDSHREKFTLANEKVMQIKSKSDALQKEIDAVHSQLPTCPTCGQVMDGE